MKRYCFALDLKDEPLLIAEYIDWHKKVWPEVIKSISDSGITHLDIYRVGNRMFMIMDTLDTFSLEEKSRLDDANPVVRQWEDLMWKYQEQLPNARPGEKWMLMENIFQL